VEFDERQHFTPLRAISLRSYPVSANMGFSKERWIQLCDQIQAGDNSPIYRDEQRAFYDSVRDILIPELGFKPLVRVFEDDVRWETAPCSAPEAASVLEGIERHIASSG